MEKNVEILEAMFQKADSDLNYLSRKLENEFENTASGNEQMNPVRMIQRIAEIRKEYSGIVQEAAAIQQTQKEAMDYFRSQMLNVCQMLQKLQDRTGSEVVAKPEAIEGLEQLLGIDLSQPSSEQKSANPGLDKEEGISKKTDVHVYSVAAENCSGSCSSASTRASSTECIEVSQEEFESVSSLVRGRVTLTDVNTVYNRLWNHFKKEGNSSPVSTSEMHYKMGLKITGSTGEAKLKVLRALKLLKMSPKGDVKLT